MDLGTEERHCFCNAGELLAEVEWGIKRFDKFHWSDFWGEEEKQKFNVWYSVEIWTPQIQQELWDFGYVIVLRFEAFDL